jgi:hypothetical protein
MEYKVVVPKEEIHDKKEGKRRRGKGGSTQIMACFKFILKKTFVTKETMRQFLIFLFARQTSLFPPYLSQRLRKVLQILMVREIIVETKCTERYHLPGGLHDGYSVLQQEYNSSSLRPLSVIRGLFFFAMAFSSTAYSFRILAISDTIFLLAMLAYVLLLHPDFHIPLDPSYCCLQRRLARLCIYLIL